MLVSTNRTVVELVAVEAVACAEAANLGLDLLLLGLKPGELSLAPGQRAQVLSDESAGGGAAFGGANPRVAIDVVWHRDRDVLHGLRLAQLHSFCESSATWKNARGTARQPLARLSPLPICS